MSKVHIKTLTPVHTGTGIEFQGNFEYLYFQEEEEIVVIDDKKILEIIGEEQINQWVAVIEKGESLLRFLQSRKRDVVPEDVARRILTMYGKPPSRTQPIREQLHTGAGKPLLAGTAIKGAIKTALLGRMIAWDVEDNRRLPNLKKRFRGREDFKDDNLLRNFFGRDPNSDIMRLLQVGDASFRQTACYLSKSINKYRDDWNFKDGSQRGQPNISQYVEAIPDGSSTSFRIKWNKQLSVKSRNLFNNNKTLLRPDKLIGFINDHTWTLLNDELNFWDEEGNPYLLNDYLDQLEALQKAVDACGPKECILRLGFGTGFRNMTGGWQKKSMKEREYQQLVHSIRDNRRRSYPDLMPYPKTRRMLADGTPLGYVKLVFED